MQEGVGLAEIVNNPTIGEDIAPISRRRETQKTQRQSAEEAGFDPQRHFE